MIRAFRSAVPAAAVLILGAGFLLHCIGDASAQTLAPNGSGVIAHFASQSDAYQDSDPIGQIFGPAGIGPYPAANPIPACPPAPAPGIVAAPGNAFSTNGGGGYTSLFNDLFSTNGNTAAQSTIDDSYLVSPLFTSDMAIMLPAFRLAQGPLAPGYAYDQINFGSNYLITSNPGLGPNPAPAFPASINGTTSAPGAYAQFDMEVEYTWTPVTINTAGVITASGPSVSLGLLNWAFLQAGGGPFATTLFSTGGLAATPAGDGIMSLTGHAWLAADPSEITVTVAPEPSLGLGVMGLAVLSRAFSRRRRACS